MSIERKRNKPSEGVQAVIKKARMEVEESPSSEQEISVHPVYEDDDFGLTSTMSAPLSDVDSPEHGSDIRTEHSPNISLEPTSEIIDSQSFPLSKLTRESSKQRRERRYRGAVENTADVTTGIQRKKKSTLSSSDRRKFGSKERHSRSHSKSPLPFSSEQSLKSKAFVRNSSSGRNSPLSMEFESVGTFRHSDREDLFDRSQERRERYTSSRDYQSGSQKQPRAIPRSRYVETRDVRYEPKGSYREGFSKEMVVGSRDRGRSGHRHDSDPYSLLDARHRSIDVGTLYHRKEMSRSGNTKIFDRSDREMSSSSLRQRGSPRMGSVYEEGGRVGSHRREHMSDLDLLRLEKGSEHERITREKDVSRKKKHRHRRHRHAEHSRHRKVPEVVISGTHGSSEESEGEGGREMELVPEKIEDLIKDIVEGTSESSGESTEDEREDRRKPEGESSDHAESETSNSSDTDENERQFEDVTSSAKKQTHESDTMVDSPDVLEESFQELQERSHSESEGEIRSPVEHPEPHIMRSRFDTSGHSDLSDDDVDQAPLQQGQPRYSGYLEELSDDDTGSVVSLSSPKQSEDLELKVDTLAPLHSPSPSPPPTPKLPLYLPALMGCRNVESYEWLDRIEEGTYGVVYKAKDKKTGDIVALKKLKMEKEKEGFPITSLREINMLLKAEHPNIVPVREIVVGSNMDKIYIVMDFIKHDLKALMSTMKEKFLEGEVKTLLLHLLRAVHHLHDNWILHRDLKTSNLLLSHDNILKVADFGLAREYGSPLLNYTPVVVTLWYRAPELLLGTKEYSTAIDVWSVGCIFAELLLHKPLFNGRSEIDQLNKIFTVLGTPNEKIWPGFNELSGSKNVTFTRHPPGHLLKKYPSLTTKSGYDLLFKLLTYDPKKRITAKEALEHSYFKEMPRPVPPQMFPTWPTKNEIAKNKRKREKSPTPPEGGIFIMKGGDQGSPGPGFSLKF